MEKTKVEKGVKCQGWETSRLLFYTRVVREDVKQTSGGRVLYTKEGQSSNVHLLFTITLL